MKLKSDDPLQIPLWVALVAATSQVWVAEQCKLKLSQFSSIFVLCPQKDPASLLVKHASTAVADPPPKYPILVERELVMVACAGICSDATISCDRSLSFVWQTALLNHVCGSLILRKLADEEIQQAEYALCSVASLVLPSKVFSKNTCITGLTCD